jgi:hypothetical protein
MPVRSAARVAVGPAAALLLFCLVAASPLWGPGLISTRAGGDSPFLLQRTQQLATNLEAGVFPIRWMPDAAYGLGYPFFSYYAALPYYLAGGFVVVGLDLLSAIKATQTLFLGAAAVAMYAWARRVLATKPRALVAAAAYTLAPFHLVNLYVRGDSLSEFAAFAFYPLILLGLERVSEHPSLRRVALPALSYAALVTTHNLSALIFSPFLAAYAAIVCLRRPRSSPPPLRQAGSNGRTPTRAALAWSAGALLLGILLSAWYWAPALGEMDYVQLTAQTTDYFNYSNHFRGADLVQRSLFFSYEIGADKETPFAMGLVQALLMLGGCAVLVVRVVRSGRAGHARGGMVSRWGFVVGGLLVSTFCITPLSLPLWDHLPLLDMVQFPWRFLSVQSLFAAILIGCLVPERGWRGWLIALVLIGALGLAQLGDLQPEYLPIAAEDVTVERLQLYEAFTGNVGTTVRHEYLPRWVVPRPYTGPALFDPEGEPAALAVAGDLLFAQETMREPTRRAWSVGAGDEGAEIAFPVYYWPGWRAAVDGQPAELRPVPDLGYASLLVPPGDHDVLIWLGHTPLRAVAEAISAVVGLGLVGILVVDRGLRRRRRGPEMGGLSATPVDPEVFLFVVVLLGALPGLVVLSPRVSAGSSDLTMDFEEMPLLHHNPAGVVLGSTRLEGYEYSSEMIDAGLPLTVTLRWQEPMPDARAELRLESPGDHLNETVHDSGMTTFSLDERTLTAALETSGVFGPGPGLNLVSLSVSQSEGDGSNAEKVYLKPIWIRETESSEGTPALPQDGSSPVRLLEGSAAWQRDAENLAVGLRWSCSQRLPANYGLALILADSNGEEWLKLDTQPGYGFLATSLWPGGRVIPDSYSLLLPPGIPPGQSYELRVGLYRVSDYEVAGEWSLPVELPRPTLRPNAPVLASFGTELALSSLEVPDSVYQGVPLELSAYWYALDDLGAGYSANWALQGADTYYEFARPLAAGSEASEWPADAYVAGRVSLGVPALAPPGEYAVSVSVVGADGSPVGTYLHPHAVAIEEREREWALPEMEHQLGARFGGLIELAGYDLVRGGDAVELILYWRALAAPDRDYTFFVHLAEPATGHPVRQVDTMPRGYTYPTGLWVAGEVVSDQVVLSLEGVPVGTYDLAIGWYVAETMTRLTANDSSGEWLAGDRLVIRDAVTAR